MKKNSSLNFTPNTVMNDYSNRELRHSANQNSTSYNQKGRVPTISHQSINQSCESYAENQSVQLMMPTLCRNPSNQQVT